MKYIGIKYDLIIFNINKFYIYDFCIIIISILFCSGFYLFYFTKTFYVYWIALDNKIFILLLLKLINRESYNFNQFICCYFTLWFDIKKYLNISDFSDIESDYKLIILDIDTKFVDNLNKVYDYL